MTSTDKLTIGTVRGKRDRHRWYITDGHRKRCFGPHSGAATANLAEKDCRDLLDAAVEQGIVLPRVEIEEQEVVKIVRPPWQTEIWKPLLAFWLGLVIGFSAGID